MITTVVIDFQCSQEELRVLLRLPKDGGEERAVVTMVVCEYFELHKEELR